MWISVMVSGLGIGLELREDLGYGARVIGLGLRFRISVKLYVIVHR